MPRPVSSPATAVCTGRRTAPGSFVSTRLLSWRAKLRLAAEPFCTGRGRPDDSALRFFERRFGRRGGAGDRRGLCLRRLCR